MPEHSDAAAIAIHNRYAALHGARLQPGMTAQVRFLVAQGRPALLVPEQAVVAQGVADAGEVPTGGVPAGRGVLRPQDRLHVGGGHQRLQRQRSGERIDGGVREIRILAEQHATRLPELIGVRVGRMLQMHSNSREDIEEADNLDVDSAAMSGTGA